MTDRLTRLGVAETIDQLAAITDLDGYVYVATPYTKFPYGTHVAAKMAAYVTAELTKGGMRAFSPIVHGHAVAHAGDIDPLDVDYWIRMNSAFLNSSVACVVVKMQGWQESKGIAAELEYFTNVKKPIVFIGDEIVKGIES